MGHFSSKMNKERPLKSISIVIELYELLFTKNEEEDVGNIWFQQEALRDIQPKLYSMFCVLFLKIVLSAVELMAFGHLGAVI